MANIFGIEIGVGLNANGLKEGIQQVNAELAKFSTGLVARFAGVDALKELGHKIYDTFKESLEQVKDIRVGTIKTGLDKETFQTVRNALDASGSSVDQFATALGFIAQRMVDVKEGGEEGEKAAKAFATLNVSLSDLQSKGRQQIFFQIAEGLQAAAKAGKLTEDQIDALKTTIGKAAVDFVPFFARGTDNVSDQITNKSEEEIARLQELAKRSKETASVWKLAMEQGGEYAAHIVEYATDLADALVVAGKRMFGGRTEQLRHEIREQQAEQEKELASKIAAVNERERAKREQEVVEQTAENRKQRNRETIAQADFDREKSEEKLLSKAERHARLQAKIKDLQTEADRLSGKSFKGASYVPQEGDDVKRAKILAYIAELKAEDAGLEKGGSGNFRQNVNELQKIGAAISVPGGNSAMQSAVQETARNSQQTVALLNRANQTLQRLEAKQETFN